MFIVNTILARKDPDAQIPALKDPLSGRGTSSTSQPLPDTRERSQHHQRQYPSSAPHASDNATSTADQRKRRQPTSPIIIDDSTAQEHVTKAAKRDGMDNISGTPIRSGSPKPATSASVVGGAGRAFERVFIGYCSRPFTIPSEVAYWHDEEHVIIKDMYPKV